jgi:NADH:ubiquinone oxidoreductase subunit 6 (subunit J)
MNPLASHWLRLSIWLLAASPILALLIGFSTDAPFRVALIITLYMWAVVCVILAFVALAGLGFRLMNRGWRAFRR